jgi:hypothetical protein
MTPKIKSRRDSATRKRFFLLLAVATWLTFLFFNEAQTLSHNQLQLDTNVRMEFDVAGDFLMLGLPAIMYGGILFWWFGTKRSEIPLEEKINDA